MFYIYYRERGKIVFNGRVEGYFPDKGELK